MKIIIFGATGTIGKKLLEQSLNLGHEVTAFVRDSSKIETKNSTLKVIVGNVLDLAAVEKAVVGHSAVLCALGAGRKGIVRAAGTANIIKAMEKAGISRIICQSSLGVGDSWDTLNFFWKHIMFGMLLKEAFKDHQTQEMYIKQSNLDWTIIRPGAFTDGQLTGNYKHGFTGNDKRTQLKISRSDVADFMLKQLTDNRYLKKTPGLSY